MTATTRRLWLYGLLLLLPALAVGGLSLGLLAREQARLAEREQAARDSRRAAVETRARLIAENIELLIGDVQSALMNTLQEAPAEEPRAFLSEWQATNPLVRDVFRATADGRLVWGGSERSLRAWLGQNPPWAGATGFAAGFSGGEAVGQINDAPVLPAPVPPAAAAPAPAAPAVAAAEGKADPQTQVGARKDISANVYNYQRARQEIQEVAKVKNAADAAASNQGYVNSGRNSYLSSAAAPSAAMEGASQSPVVNEPESVPESPAALGEAQATVSLFGVTSERDEAPAREVAKAERRVEKKVDAAEALKRTNPTVFNAPVIVPPRGGWTPWRSEDGLHIFGWRELPDRTVIGLELRLDAVKARLGEVFPAAPEEGEAYALRDAAGRTWHTVGGGKAELPVALEVPLSESALPGWNVVGLAAAAGYVASANGEFFALGATLVALLVLAILAAGALLLRQARLSEVEAALKTSFVANVSHELKTPLTTIRLYAELLAQGRVREPAKQADYLATIGQETERLSRLVGNVLDFSRLEQGKKKYARTDFDLACELRRLAATHAPRLAEAGLDLRLELPETLPATTDRDAVEQIVINLLDNACKYASDGGEITLSLRAEAGGTRLIVADRGPGVPEGQRERIFEKFHRVDDRLTAEKSGAGLGLGIARQLARGLGGDLRCAARAGGGAEFALTLPSS